MVVRGREAGAVITGVRDPRFAVVGAYVLDCVARTPTMPAWGETLQAQSVGLAPGGKALIQAVTLARRGARVSAVGAVGDDVAGQSVTAALAREHVDTIGLEVRAGARTPVCVCLVGDDGDTAFLWRVDEGAGPSGATIHAAGGAFSEADTVLITFEPPLLTVTQAAIRARRQGSLVVLQPAPANERIGLADLPWSDIDVLVPNEREARSLLGDSPIPQLDLARGLGEATAVPVVVVTLGADGCVVNAPDGSGHYPAPPAPHIADTTGASDVFVATLAHQLTTGAKVPDAVDEAQRSAVQSIAHAGGYSATRHSPT